MFLYVFSLEIQLSDGKNLDHSSGVKPATCCACPNTECRGLYMLIGLKWQVVVRCIDIYRIVDHPCLNFLFISYWKLLNQGFLVVKLKSSLRKFYGRHHDLVDRYGISVTNDHGYVLLVISTSRSFPRSWLITRFVTRLTRRVSLVEQELATLPEHTSSPPVFSGVRVTRSLVLYVCFVDRCLSFCTFSFGHCVVCSSSIYGFWLPLWYLQTLLKSVTNWGQPTVKLVNK